MWHLKSGIYCKSWWDHMDCVNHQNCLQSSHSWVKNNHLLLTTSILLLNETGHQVSTGYLWPAMQHNICLCLFLHALSRDGATIFSALDCMPGSAECWCGKWQLLLKIQRRIVPTEVAKRRVNWLIKYIQHWTIKGFSFPFCPFSTSAKEVGSK